LTIILKCYKKLNYLHSAIVEQALPEDLLMFKGLRKFLLIPYKSFPAPEISGRVRGCLLTLVFTAETIAAGEIIFIVGGKKCDETQGQRNRQCERY